MKRLLLLLAALASAALLATGAATADTFTDPAGDASGGPDVTAVTVTNDAAGKVTMSITVALVTPEAVMGVFLDTALNGQVFDATGRVIELLAVDTGLVVPVVFASDAAGNLNPVDIPSLQAGANATTVDLSFSKGDLGIDKGFGFWIGTSPSFDFLGPFADRAPDGTSLYKYILSTPQSPPPPVIKPVIGVPVGTPASPQAGKRFTALYSVTRSDDGSALTGGTAACAASIAGKALPCAKTLKAGSARVSVLVPKTAKGKLLKVKLTVMAGSQSTSKTATFHIR